MTLTLSLVLGTVFNPPVLEFAQLIVPYLAFDENGHMYPRLIHWEDGKTYEVDRILDVRPAPAARAGGQGDRYTIRMNNRETYIFFEHNPDYGGSIPGRWFVERREA